MKCKIKEPADCGPALWFVDSNFSRLWSHMVEKVNNIPGAYSTRALIPFIRTAPPSWCNQSPKAPPPNRTTQGVRTSTHASRNGGRHRL